MSDQRKEQDKGRRYIGDPGRALRYRCGDGGAPVAVEGDAPHAWGTAGWT
jgi:hypothetical protein